MTRTYTGPGFVRGSNNTVGRRTVNGGLAGAEFGNKTASTDTLEEMKKKIKKGPGKYSDKRPVAKKPLKMVDIGRPAPQTKGVNESELDPNQRALLRRMRRKAS